MSQFLTVTTYKGAKNPKVKVLLNAQLMARVGATVLGSIQQRILQAKDVTDNAAPKLADSYAKRKQNKGRQPVRNWLFTGTLMRSMKVLEAGNGMARLGFTDGVYPVSYSIKRSLDFWGNERRIKMRRPAVTVQDVVRINNARHRQWGMSPVNYQVLVNAIKQEISQGKANISAEVANG